MSTSASPASLRAMASWRCLVLDNGELAIPELIAEGQGPTHPEPLALGRRNLVPDTLGCDLALELGKGQQNVEG